MPQVSYSYLLKTISRYKGCTIISASGMKYGYGIVTL
jgi:hypothetical protein